MQWVYKILGRLWAVYFYVVFALTFLLLYPFLLLSLQNERTYERANRLRRFWAKTIFFLTGISYEVRVEQQLKDGQPYIICANHASILDICLLAIGISSDRIRFMAKDEFRRIPVFGIFFRTVDIAVNRENNVDAFRAFKEADEALRKGWDVIIFPEGRTSKKAPEMLPFKNGPFRLAVDQQIPIVPVTFLDNWKLFMWSREWWGRPGHARMIIHEPVDTTGMTEQDVSRLKQQVYDIIEYPLKQDYESRQAVSG